jgi:arylsulfatase A-like enzyme
VIPEIALNSDLASTLIELSGLPIPQAHTGRSLAPLIRGKQVADWRKDFLCEFLAVPQTIPLWEGVHGESVTYARYFVDGPDEPPYEFLHDLKKDPQQLTNLATDSDAQHLLKNMRNRCDQLVANAGPSINDIFKIHIKPPKKSKK